MAQTTGAMSCVNATIEVSTDGAVWTDISGSTNKIEPGGGNRLTGESYTFDGDGSIVTSGKRETTDINIAVIYSETAAEGFEYVRSAFENVTLLYIRYSPAGGGVGTAMYSADPGYVIEFQYPAIEASEGGPIMCEFVVKTSKIVRSVVT